MENGEARRKMRHATSDEEMKDEDDENEAERGIEKRGEEAQGQIDLQCFTRVPPTASILWKQVVYDF
jgi:hypothetical protein